MADSTEGGGLQRENAIGRPLRFGHIVASNFSKFALRLLVLTLIPPHAAPSFHKVCTSIYTAPPTFPFSPLKK